MILTKTDGRARYPSAAYAYSPDVEPSKWKLRLWETPVLKVTARQVSKALTDFSRVQIPAADLPAVKRNLLTAWQQVHSKSEDVPVILKQHGGLGMTQEEMAVQLLKLETDLTKATARADRLEVLYKLGEEDRAAYDSLTEPEQEAFHTAEGDARTSILAKAKDAIAKKEEPAAMSEDIQKRFDDIQKRLDEEVTKRTAAEEVAKRERDARELQDLSKRAETEFGSLPGTPEEKAKVLKSLTKLTGEERTAVEKLFSTGNACMAQGLKPVGKDGDVTKTGDGAWSKIEKLAKDRSTADKVTFEKAVDLVTQEHPELYNEYLDSQGKK